MNYTILNAGYSFIESLFSLLFGTLTPLITVLLGIITCFDLLYLIVEPVGNVMEKTFDGKRFGGFRLTSKDAVVARERGLNGEGHSLVIYFKLRSKTYMIVAIVFYIILGAMPLVLRFILRYVAIILQAAGLIVA